MSSSPSARSKSSVTSMSSRKSSVAGWVAVARAAGERGAVAPGTGELGAAELGAAELGTGVRGAAVRGVVRPELFTRSFYC